MTAFRFFDPWAAIDDAATAGSAAKVAIPAKPDKGRQTALASLATLAGSPADRTSSRAPSEPPITDGVLTTWSEVEEGRAAIVDHDGRIPRAWAEECRVVVRWINDHFRASPIGQCAHCGQGARPGDPFVMLFAGEDRADVHASCWRAWQAAQEVRALAALTADPR
jgi:hypothetical protein